jgi:tetratricopeptide (TPR) repeat protein
MAKEVFTSMVAHRPLDHRTFGDVGVQALRHPVLDFLGGPVLLDPACAKFRHKRDNRPCDTFDLEAEFDAYVNGEWVYIGPKYHHFGHIMSEMVHRIVPSKTLFPDIQNYLLVTTSDDEEPRFDTLSPTYQEVLEFCEIGPSQIAILNTNTIVEKLSICEQGSNFGGTPTPWYLDLLREFSGRRLDEIHGSRPSPARVYVSKSRIPHGGTILGERYIEGLLAEEGFLIFHPEESPLTLQMDVYRKAEALVFSEGSACHGVELLGTGMLDRTYVLIRRKETRNGLASILRPRSRQLHMFVDTFLLGTIAVHAETRQPHTEFSVSLADVEGVAASFRKHELARLDGMDVREYFQAAEEDLKSYFSFHMSSDIAAVDPWRVGEVRLEFEKLRSRFLAGRQQTPLAPASPTATGASAEHIEQQAWAAHRSKKWLEAARCWEIYRERFPNSGEGYILGSVALIELGRFYEADALLRLAMEIFPDVEDVYSHYALVAHHRHDWRESLARWEAYRARFPRSSMGYSLGATAFLELEQYVDADNLVLLGLERIPEDEELLEKYAWVAHHSDNKLEAQRRWERLKAAYPHNRAALLYVQESAP